MDIRVLETSKLLGKEAAALGARKIAGAVEKNGRANIILATGASQFEMLKNLVPAENVDWSRVTMFHLDEYIGLSVEHPASFRRYLKERFVDRVGPLKSVHFIDLEAGPSPEATCEKTGNLIAEHPIDVAMVGIGENGHLAFNDPPADFETEQAFLVVDLDQKCRRQQMGEGWFETLDDVPKQAISMSIRQIMKSRAVVVSVPDKRKAQAVKDCLEGDVTPMHPASILQNHEDCTVFLNESSASLLESMDDLSEARLAASEMDLKAGRVKRGSARQLMKHITAEQ